jgi:hypothetical protein
LQRKNFVPPELWENRSQEPPPPVKQIIKSKDHSSNKWTQVRLHQDPYLKTEKHKRKPIPIQIIETGSAKPRCKTKPKWKRIIGSVPLLKTESESERDTSPTFSKYIHDVLTRKASHDPTFGVFKMILTVHLK